MTVNKKTMVIVSGTAGLVLGLSACGTETYDYEVSGAVEAQQVDYDCPGEDIAMDTVAFVAGTGRGSSGGSGGRSSNNSRSDSDSGSSNSNSNSNSGSNSRRQQNGSTPSAGSGKGSTSGSSSNSSSGSTSQRSSSPSAKPVKNSGVKLSKKPEKPEKVKGKKVPKLKYKVKPKGCETEYEVFVLADDGNLYEQDVRKVDYDNCVTAKVPAGKKNKVFPLCTKG